MKILLALSYLSLNFTAFAADADKPNEKVTLAPLQLNITSAEIQQQLGRVSQPITLGNDIIQSTGSLTRLGAGILTLAPRQWERNPYTGATIVAGTLNLAQPFTINSITINGATTIPSEPLIITGNQADTRVTIIHAGNLPLSLGTPIFGGGNDYAGGQLTAAGSINPARELDQE